MKRFKFVKYGSIVLSVICYLSFSVACSRMSPEEQATEAALNIYQQLLEGDTAAFLNGKALIDSLPAGRSRQQALAFGQYVKDIAQQHGGLQGVTRSSNAARYDTIAAAAPFDHFVHVFLLLSFNDSTQEEITVPMVFVNDEWKMK